MVMVMANGDRNASGDDDGDAADDGCDDDDDDDDYSSGEDARSRPLPAFRCSPSPASLRRSSGPCRPYNFVAVNYCVSLSAPSFPVD